MKINIGKILGTVAQTALPIVAVAVITHRPVKKALKDAARQAAEQALAKR